jgi:hypothetical protein
MEGEQRGEKNLSNYEHNFGPRLGMGCRGRRTANTSCTFLVQLYKYGKSNSETIMDIL